MASNYIFGTDKKTGVLVHVTGLFDLKTTPMAGQKRHLVKLEVVGREGHLETCAILWSKTGFFQQNQIYINQKTKQSEEMYELL